ncbi:bifunctional 5,10-methylenetetrahydrofolate dehydrogenase/5,10-methenyltetrahydrofolate cyclohydrolase [Candidatus Woesearchaeota archaeon]|nr:bifunctional 5,10-methylenetetrahydrofolate dehydrogenase/5,10-methenyltetrahydrofolate cyclohydrolase [Candidatus Woesearchaeota archaeon]
MNQNNSINIGGLEFSLDELAHIRPEKDLNKLEQFYQDPTLKNFKLKGNKVRDLIVSKLNQSSDQFEKQTGKRPGLGIIQSGDLLQSNTYVKIKEKKAVEAGFNVFKAKFKDCVDQKMIEDKIIEFNNSDLVHGFIIQLPLIPQEKFNIGELIKQIDPTKDADCFHPYNVGLFYSGDGYALAPATPQGTLMILQAYGIHLEHEDKTIYSAAISGRSDIAGKPFGRIIEAKQNNYNVDYHLMNSRTDTKKFFKTGSYNILISAIGKANYYRPEDVPQTTKIIIDVGVNFIKNPNYVAGAKGKKGREFIQVGDFHKTAYEKAKIVVPSPGGSGPGTVAALLVNTWKLACKKENFL